MLGTCILTNSQNFQIPNEDRVTNKTKRNFSITSWPRFKHGLLATFATPFMEKCLDVSHCPIICRLNAILNGNLVFIVIKIYTGIKQNGMVFNLNPVIYLIRTWISEKNVYDVIKIIDTRLAIYRSYQYVRSQRQSSAVLPDWNVFRFIYMLSVLPYRQYEWI